MRYGRPSYTLVILLPLLLLGANAYTSTPTSTPYMIVVTGEELLTGVYADGHTHFMTRTLHPLGLTCVGSVCVDDKPADIRAALEFAVGRAPLILVTGGLGPTASDITREVLADFMGIALKENAEVIREMSRRFRTTPEKLRANVRRQARVPIQGRYIKNRSGSAVGLVFEKEKQVIVALPGPPRELQPMVQSELLPYLRQRYGIREPGATMTLRFVGLGQSRIAQVLSEHIHPDSETTVSSQFRDGRVDFTFTRLGDTPVDRAALTAISNGLKTYLGDSIYAQDEQSLEEHIIEQFINNKQTLILAEIGSGGSLGSALAPIPESRQVVKGAYSAPSLGQLARLSVYTGRPATVELLADYLAHSSKSTWVMVVGEIRSLDSGVNALQVAVRKPPGSVCVQELVCQKPVNQQAQARLTTRLLDMLRRQL